jgi:UDPglucose 6-dehydrogenase
MKISVIGTGYVGLVSGTCFAEMGNDVVCVDIDSNKIENLKNGIIPIYEPGLEEMVKRNYKEQRLQFTTDIRTAVESSLVNFIAVGTPPGEDGSADLRYVLNVARDIGKYMNGYKIIVDKSTVPVGTAERVKKAISEQLEERGVSLEFDVVSNPEFLKEGAAVEDFMRPDRIVIGVEDVRTAEIMKQLYEFFVKNGNPVYIMDLKSAEMTKYAANAMLATKISFINEIANICESVGANVDLVRLGIGSDSRIGYKFLYPGVGYGGSCFPKDVQALIRTADASGYSTRILKAVEEVNFDQKSLLLKKIISRYGEDLKGKMFAIWGLAFKPKTDDMREAPSIVIIRGLLERGAEIRVYDPEATKEARKIFGERIDYAENNYEVLRDADAVVLVTEWNIFRNSDFDKVKSLLKEAVVFDGRNQYSPSEMLQKGFEYYSIGRQI